MDAADHALASPPGSPMRVVDGEPDLLAGVEEAVGGDAEGGEEEAEEEGEEQDAEAAAQLRALLEQFEGAETTADRASQEADQLRATVERLLDRCQQLLNAQAAGTTGPRMGDIRAAVVAAMDAVNLSTTQLTATVHRHTANLAQVMTNVVCNHLARGPADAPFFVGPDATQPQGAVDFCFNADNPTLPPGSYPDVPRVEARVVRLF